MGYTVVAHLARSPVDVSALDGLPRGLKWRLYRDEPAQVWLLDVFADPFSEKNFFSQDLYSLARRLRDSPPPQLATFREALEMLGMGVNVPPALVPLNLRLSGLLRQDVLSLASNDDGMDVASLSRKGEPLSVACRADAEVEWTADKGVHVRPLRDEEEDPPQMLVDAEALAELEEIDGVTVAPPAARSSLLHALALQREADFLDGQNTYLDLGSFDCLLRVPEPIARSEKGGGGLWPFGRGRT